MIVRSSIASIVPSDMATPLYVMIKSVSIITQYQYNTGDRLQFPVFKIGHYHAIVDL